VGFGLIGALYGVDAHLHNGKVENIALPLIVGYSFMCLWFVGAAIVKYRQLLPYYARLEVKRNVLETKKLEIIVFV
jgi:hypothetical protein